MPKVRNDRLYNVGYLCSRDGVKEKYEKLHVTTDEVMVWKFEKFKRSKKRHL